MFICAASLHGFSAVCWLFAEYLYPHLKYPIGLIEASVGGTVIEAWSSPEALHDCTSATKRWAWMFDDLCGYFSTWLLYLQTIKCQPVNYNEQRNVFNWRCTNLRVCVCVCRANNNDPSALWNGMIHPLLANTLFGVLWYQGNIMTNNNLVS